MQKNHLYQRGFTLIELMITVVIVGVLAAVAIPNYSEYVSKGKRAEARANLQQLGQYMQRFFAANDRYGTDRAGVSIVIPSALTLVPQGASASTASYSYDVPNSTINDQEFTLRMQPVNAMANDKCGSFTLTNLGVKGIVGQASGVTSADCWR